MNRHRNSGIALAAAAIVLVLSACTSASAGPEPQRPGDGSTTTAPTTTSSTVAPSKPTTTSATPPVVDGAEGSGCTPGPGELPDGEWFGYVLTTSGTALEFDLACWFTGDAAAIAAEEDGAESPPPNDYYVRNDNETIRALSVAGGAGAVWFPDFGDPSSEATTTYAEWIDLIEDRDFVPGVWLEVEDGFVVGVREQWVP